MAETPYHEDQNKREETFLGAVPIPKLLLRLAAPASLGLVASSLYNLIDGIFIGKGVGADALGGVGAAFSIQLVIMGIGQMIGIGASSIISRVLGKGDRTYAAKTLGHIFVLPFVFSIIVTVIGFLFLDTIVRFLGTTDELAVYAADYLGIIFPGSIFLITTIAGNTVVRAEGAAVKSMKIIMSGVLLNILLDPIFIFVFKLGVSGAAAATILSQGVSFFLLLCFFVFKRQSVITLKKRDLIPNRAIINEIIFLGLPNLVRQCTNGILITVVNNSFIRYGGESSGDYITIFGISFRILMITFMPLFGLNMGMRPVLGYNIGARNPIRVRQTIITGMLFSSIYGLAMTVAIILFPYFFYGIFVTDTEIIALGSKAIRIMFLALPTVGISLIAVLYCQSIGRKTVGLLLGVARQLFLLIPFVILFPRFFGLWGVFYAYPSADLVIFAVAFLFLFVEIRNIDKRVLKVAETNG